MDESLRFLVENGYAVVFVMAVVNQLGIPFPAGPWLLAAGALARSGELALFVCLGLASAASLLAHVAWYEAGRRSGIRVLRFVCRVALEPDACVRRTEALFARRGPSALVVAHFVPGLVTVAQPLAGALGMPRPRFLAWNLVGSVLWAGGWIGLGFVFSRALADVARASARFGGTLAIVLGAMVIGYVGWKLHVRQRILRELEIARISPEELERRRAAGEPLVVVDLRHAVELEVDRAMIPGALRIPAEELEARHGEIPRGGEIVVYCS
jgi:membrane protein DedA with SNARE-associated domain